jgi:hypothetical protein
MIMKRSAPVAETKRSSNSSLRAKEKRERERES